MEVRVLSGASGMPRFAGLFDVCEMMGDVDNPQLSAAERLNRDTHANAAARSEMLRLDAAHSLGENLEQADMLIKAAFELADGFAAAQR